MSPATFSLVMFALGGGPLGLFRFWFERKFDTMDDYYKSGIVLCASTLISIVGWQLIAPTLAWEDVIAAATAIVGGGSLAKKATAHPTTQRVIAKLGPSEPSDPPADPPTS